MVNARPDPIFIADSTGLDFLNTIATPVDRPVEWLTSGEDLLEWLVDAGLLPTDAAQSLRIGAAPGELDAVAARARALREWARAFVVAHIGKPLHRKVLSDLEPLNRILARDEEFTQIEAAPKGQPGLRIKTHRRWRSPEALLRPIASALADLICNENFAYVKACEGDNCTLLFADRTRGRARRWCSMALCGNRAKQAAHRRRALRSTKQARRRG